MELLNDSLAWVDQTRTAWMHRWAIPSSNSMAVQDRGLWASSESIAPVVAPVGWRP